jgi:hypothetical protein
MVQLAALIGCQALREYLVMLGAASFEAQARLAALTDFPPGE